MVSVMMSMSAPLLEVATSSGEGTKEEKVFEFEKTSCGMIA